LFRVLLLNLRKLAGLIHKGDLMKYYRMTNKIVMKNWDGREPTGLFQSSHDLVQMKTGQFLIDYGNNESGEPFSGSLICELDDEEGTGIFPTFYTSPALIGKKSFYDDLVEIGIDNIEVHPVVINDSVNDRTIKDYVLLNIIGRISCAVMEESIYNRINDSADPYDPYESMNIIDELVIDASKVSGHDLFVVHEDTDCIVISERIYKHLQIKGYTDIYFEELKQVN